MALADGLEREGFALVGWHGYLFAAELDDVRQQAHVLSLLRAWGARRPG